MNSRLSLLLSSPKTNSQNTKGMDRWRDEMVHVANKVLENVNGMSFLNLDDQQVHSIMRIREIARGIVENKIDEVTKDDVDSAMSCSIDKMVNLCMDLDEILCRIDMGGVYDGHWEPVSQMKETVSTVVAKRAKLAAHRNCNPAELVYGDNAVTEESKVALAIIASNNSVDIGDNQKNLLLNEVKEIKAEIGNKDDQNEYPGNVIEGTLNSGNGDVGKEKSIVAADGETGACNGVQNGQVDQIMIEDVELVFEDDYIIGHGQNVKQETLNVTSELINESGDKEVRRSVLTSAAPLSVTWPADRKIDLDWVKKLMATLEFASKKVPHSDFQSVIPIAAVDEIIMAASSILSKEPNCVKVDCHGEDSRVVVVGDIHGQFHDLLNLFKLAGLPSENQFYVFNGDYVDRGAWGVEVLLVLLSWKILMPNRVYLLRGNHETGYCTSVYGFEEEVKTKFDDQGEVVYKKFLECFKELPLASVISSCVYTCHGGLFRSMDVGPFRRSKRKRAQKLELGSLEDLSKVNRRLIDVADEDSSLLSDVLWSDPAKRNGLTKNAERGLGLSWGPDCTEMFLKRSNLKLMIRSHEGPDARVDQDTFGDMMSGYSMDHAGESGKIYTLFSAPSYPQFGETKYENDGAYAILKAPDFEKLSIHSFKAVERPKLTTYAVDDVEDENSGIEKDSTSIIGIWFPNNMQGQSTTNGFSASQATVPALACARVEFETLGISNPPSWSVPLADNAGGTKLVQLTSSPAVEGLPLPSNLQEPHKAVIQYLLELVAALKHTLSTRTLEGDVRGPTGEGTKQNGNNIQKE